MLEMILPHAAPFLGALLVTLLLTPLVREFHRRIGMVDKPDARRINTAPIPRGGGIALVAGVTAAYLAWTLFATATGRVPRMFTVGYRLIALSGAIALLGLVDDRKGLKPIVKLAGQAVVAVLAWAWADVGFRGIWPEIPAALDAVLTLFWIVGAVNAFNLIDGLDGLASGIAFIATLGMAGALIFVGKPHLTAYHFALAGGLLGFLRYNYNPATVFLGDSGSMYIGFSLAVLPLASDASNSFLVSVGVPLLAMGVPIFDTSLAIVRRTLRRVLGGKGGEGQVMTADTDHLHHRLLRSVGLNQRKTAWILYAGTIFCVGVGLVGLWLESRAAGLWIFAVAVAAVVVFKDTARIELFDMGRLLSGFARAHDTGRRRRYARLAIPFYLTFDVLALVAVHFLVCSLQGVGVGRAEVRVAMPIRVVSMFAVLFFMRTYVTAWSRAFGSNYIRLGVACAGGALLGGIAVYYSPYAGETGPWAFILLYAVLSFVALVGVRMIRGVVRDCFYALDCRRLVGRKDVSRILVYGSGLRYRAFRRELVRRTDANDRIIVGLIDDDLLLRGHYIGGVKVCGTLLEAPEIINRLNVDAVVVACEMSDDWKTIVRKTLEPTGVKVTQFTFGEGEL